MKNSLLLLSLPLLINVFVNGDIAQQVLHDRDTPIVKSVAIIGGGASGTSTAFWLSNVFPEDDDNVFVTTTIFERNHYLGGRSTTVPIKDDATTFGTIELGASIFVEANKNLMMATEKFNLNRTRNTALADELSTSSGNLAALFSACAKKARPGLGVWDGKEFLFEETGSYWDSMKAIWRYGFTPLKFQRKQKATVEKFMEIYDNFRGFENVAKIVKSLEFETLVNQTAADYLTELGINERFSKEILQTATRGNYCQDLNALHAFAVMVSMEAGHGTWAVEEGNFRIFEEFAKRSRAAIQLETQVVAVTNITEMDSLGNNVNRYMVTTQDGNNQVFDEVVLAAPLAYSGIEFPFPTKNHHRDYHVVHVTLIAGHADPSYFNRTLDTMPTFVVTTGSPLADRFENGKAPFDTFSVHRVLDNGENVIKIFSPNKLQEEELDQLFLNRSWIHYKSWHAFPNLHPLTEKDEFPPFILKADQDDDSGIIYTGAFENFISTMETQTIAGKNAARLIYDKWCSTKHGFNKYCKEFGNGWGNH